MRRWQLSGCCTHLHFLSSLHGQWPLPDRAPSSSGLWLQTPLHPLWPPYSHCGSVRKGTCPPFKGLGPGFMRVASREMLKQKIRHHISWLASWSISYFCWVSLVPQCPCGEYPPPWPHHNAAGPLKIRMESLGWGVDPSLMVPQKCSSFWVSQLFRLTCSSAMSRQFSAHSSSHAGPPAPPPTGCLGRLCCSWCGKPL